MHSDDRLSKGPRKKVPGIAHSTPNFIHVSSVSSVHIFLVARPVGEPGRIKLDHSYRGRSWTPTQSWMQDMMELKLITSVATALHSTPSQTPQKEKNIKINVAKHWRDINGPFSSTYIILNPSKSKNSLLNSWSWKVQGLLGPALVACGHGHGIAVPVASGCSDDGAMAWKSLSAWRQWLLLAEELMTPLKLMTSGASRAMAMAPRKCKAWSIESKMSKAGIKWFFGLDSENESEIDELIN